MKPRIKWRHQYDQEADEREGDNAIIECLDESLTQQQFTDDANLNIIAKRFGLETIPSGPLDLSHFRDTTEDPDLRDVLEYQRAAKNQFMELSPKLRKRFHNSPKEMWDFLQDPENHEEAIRLGLLHAPTPDSAGADAPAPGQSADSQTPSSTGKGSTGDPPPVPKTPPEKTP